VEVRCEEDRPAGRKQAGMKSVCWRGPPSGCRSKTLRYDEEWACCR